MNNFDIDLINKYVEEKERDNALSLLKKGYPVQYIIGNVDFYNLNIKVNENVLIPRFETEYLVDDLIKLINKYNFINPNIIDIGTGSGCIALAMKQNVKSNVTGIDISKKALDVAKKNANINNIDVNFIEMDMNNIDIVTKFDVLVSNPPYVPYNSDVDLKIKYEPQNAIYAPDDGLYFYKVILSQCQKLLNKKNIIAFEIGDKQSESIIKIIKEYYPNSSIISKEDLNHYDRYIYVINE